MYSVLCTAQTRVGFSSLSNSELRKLLADMPERTFYRAKKQLEQAKWIVESESGFALLVGFDSELTAKNGSNELPEMAVAAKNGSELTATNGSNELPKMAVAAKNGSELTATNGSNELPKMAVAAKNGSELTAKNGSNELPKMAVEGFGKEVIISCLPASQPASQPNADAEHSDSDDDPVTYGDYLEYLSAKKKLPECDVLGLASALFDKGAEADKVRIWRDRQRKRDREQARKLQTQTQALTPANTALTRRDPGFWEPVLTWLSTRHSAENFATWLAPLDGWLADGQVHVRAPDLPFVDWVKSHYADSLHQALVECGAATEVERGIVWKYE